MPSGSISRRPTALSEETPFSRPLVDRIRTRSSLEEFVARRRESGWLEFKTLADFKSCGRCEYCRPKSTKHRQYEDPGFPITQTVCAFANGSGGVLVVGARRTNLRTGRHVLEERGCPTKTYLLDDLTKLIAEGTDPPVEVQARSFGGGGARPAVFVVNAPASLTVHSWRDKTGVPRYPIRFHATSLEMSTRELVFRVRTRETISQNVEFRRELMGVVWRLFDSVMDRPAERPRRHTTFDRILREDPYGVSRMAPPLRRWVTEPAIQRAVLDLPTKMATLHTPRDAAFTVSELSHLEQDLVHGPLDHRELRLLAAGRLLSQQEDLRTRLAPFDILEDLLGERWKDARDQLVSGYEDTYEQVYDRLRESGVTVLDDENKRQSVYELADALSLLLPLAMAVLLFYEELAAEYGTTAVGHESRWLHPRRRARPPR